MGQPNCIIDKYWQLNTVDTFENRLAGLNAQEIANSETRAPRISKASCKVSCSLCFGYDLPQWTTSEGLVDALSQRASGIETRTYDYSLILLLSDIFFG
jgi:hypothetical protein